MDMKSMTTKDKIKMLLFNPIVFVLIFISMFIAFNSSNPAIHGHWIALFLLTIFYPVFCEMAYKSLADNLGVAFLFLLLFWYMF